MIMKTTRDIFIEVITHLTEPQLTHKQITITPEGREFWRSKDKQWYDFVNEEVR